MRYFYSKVKKIAKGWSSVLKVPGILRLKAVPPNPQPSEQGRTQGRGFKGRNPSVLEVKATLLMADIIKQLSNDSVRSSSNQT